MDHRKVHVVRQSGTRMVTLCPINSTEACGHGGQTTISDEVASRREVFPVL